MARTLDDLAALSGVSRATVSRVINGGPVSEETRRRVLEVLERTGYRPNRAARTLASGRSGVVGVVMHIDPQHLFRDPYFAGLLTGMSNALAEKAVGMMLWLGDRTKDEILDQIQLRGLLDGVIVTAHSSGLTPRSYERYQALLLENIRRFQRGEALLNVVDKRLGY